MAWLAPPISHSSHGSHGVHGRHSNRVAMGADRWPAAVTAMVAASGRAGKASKVSLEQVIEALSHSNADVAAELGKLKWLRREGMTWQSAARLLDVLEKILPIELPPNACVTALITAANAQALQRRKISPERLQVFQDTLELSFSAVSAGPEELSYGVWALVKLGDRGSPVLQRLLQRSEMQHFESAQLSRFVWSLATATLRESNNARLLSCLSSQAQQVKLHPQLGLAMLAWSFAKLRFNEEGLMDAIGSHAVEHVKVFKINELSSIAWAFATQQVAQHSARPLLVAVSQAAVPAMGKFKNQELAMLLWSYAKLEVLDNALISAASQEVLLRLEKLSAQHVANAAWSFAKLRSGVMVRRLASHALQHRGELKAIELAGLVWALAQRGDGSHQMHHSTLAMQLAEEATTRKMKPQEVCNLLWSAATLAFHQEELLKTLVARLEPEVLEKFGMLDVANALWALAKLQQHPEVMMLVVDRLRMGNLQSATPQQLSNIAWALATVALDDRIVMDRIAQEAQSQLPDFSSQGLANLVWALTQTTQTVTCNTFLQAIGDRLVSMKLDDLFLSSSEDLATWGVDLAAVCRCFSEVDFHHPCLSWSSAIALPRLAAELDRRGKLRALQEPKVEAVEAVAVAGPKVLWDADECCVIFKPAGWQVDTEGSEEDFLAKGHASREMLSEFVRATYTAVKHPILEDGANNGRQTDVRCKNGFLHRLDVPSSGLILVAKKYSAYFDLLLQLHRGDILRDYVVLLHGHLCPERQRVALRLAKEALTTWSGRQSVVTQGGKLSLSLLRVGGLATGPSSFSLVAIRIGSGRRHQIRAHTGHIGHPTVSDGRYTTEETFREDQAWCDRNFLHRFSLSFNSRGSQSAVCELPEDLCDALWQLRPLDMESAKTMDLWQSIETFSTLTWDEMPLLENEVPLFRKFWK